MSLSIHNSLLSHILMSSILINKNKTVPSLTLSKYARTFKYEQRVINDYAPFSWLLFC